MRVARTEVFNSKCNPSATMVNVAVHLDEDVADLLPYLNASQEKARYTAGVPFVRFLWQGRIVNVESRVVRVFGFDDDEAARRGGAAVIDHLEAVRANLDAIEPDHTSHAPPSVLDVLKHLPRLASCAACGYPSCTAFASAVCRGDCAAEQCPPLQEERFADIRKALLEIVG